MTTTRAATTDDDGRRRRGRRRRRRRGRGRGAERSPTSEARQRRDAEGERAPTRQGDAERGRPTATAAATARREARTRGAARRSRATPRPRARRRSASARREAQRGSANAERSAQRQQRRQSADRGDGDRRTGADRRRPQRDSKAIGTVARDRDGRAAAAAADVHRARVARSVPITEVVKEGDEVIVQISKEPIGTKGARVTSHVSLPGPLRRVPADGRSRRHLEAHRLGARARAAARGDRGAEAAAGRAHRAHGRRGPDQEGRSRPTSATWSSSGRTCREEARGRARRRPCSTPSSTSC